MSVLLQQLLHTLSPRPGRIDNFQTILIFLTQRWFNSQPGLITIFPLNPQPSRAQYNHAGVFVAFNCHSLSPSRSFSDLDEHHGKNFASARCGKVKFEKQHQERGGNLIGCVCVLKSGILESLSCMPKASHWDRGTD